MRILVYGAGVQGCQLAHSLAQNKKNVVTLLARGEWKEVIDQKGLTIRHMLQRKTTVDRMQTTDVLAPEDVDAFLDRFEDGMKHLQKIRK